MNQARAGDGFYFFAEKMNESVNGVFFDFAAMTPQGILNGLPRDNFSLVSGEKLQEAEFGKGEKNFAAFAKGAEGGDVENKIAYLQDILDFRSDAATECADAGEKFGEGKRFGEVVVGTGVETLYDIAESIAGGEHEDGDILFAAAKLASDFEAVYARQHDVEQNDVEWSCAGEEQRGIAVASNVYFVRFLAQALRKELRHVRIIFNDENIHDQDSPKKS